MRQLHDRGFLWLLQAKVFTGDHLHAITVDLNSQFELTTVTLYSTSLSTTVYFLTQTLSSVMALPQSQPNGLNGVALPSGIGIIIVLVLIGHLAVRKRKK